MIDSNKPSTRTEYTLVITGKPPDLCGQLAELPEALTSGTTIEEVRSNIVCALSSLCGREHAARSTIVRDGRMVGAVEADRLRTLHKVT